MRPRRKASCGIRAAVWLALSALAVQAYLPVHLAGDWARIALHLIEHDRAAAVQPAGALDHHDPAGDDRHKQSHGHDANDCLICAGSAGMGTFLMPTPFQAQLAATWPSTVALEIPAARPKTTVPVVYRSRAPPTIV
jgi:hypothetical protein